LEDAVTKRTEELMIEQKQLQYEIDVKNRLFSIISHDLKSPFNSLLGMTFQMSQMAGSSSKDKLVEYAWDVNEAGRRVFTLLQNLLEWSRMQLEGATCEAEKVSLRDLTQENIHVLTLMTIEKDMTLTNNIKKDTAFVDPDMARTVIQNLIFYEIKFFLQFSTIYIYFFLTQKDISVASKLGKIFFKKINLPTGIILIISKSYLVHNFLIESIEK